MTDLRASGKLLLGLLLLETWIGFIHALIDREPVLHETSLLKPKVVIAVLARNSEHSLPYFLGCIERLDYPKDRISIWAATDHNIDNTTAVLHAWLTGAEHLYHSVHLQTVEEEDSYVDELGPKHWPESRFTHVMKLRQAALAAARAQWADYILFADSDNLLTNTQVLNQLIAENRTLVAPMLESRTLYSNFWCGMTSQGYYKRTPHYVPIRNWKRTGCHPVPMIHSTMLIDLRRSASAALAFYPVHHYYLWALDDIMAFAFSARQAGNNYIILISYITFLLTTVQYKEEPDVADKNHDSGPNSKWEVVDFKLETSSYLHIASKPKDTMAFNQVYLINLKRREDRRDRMLRSLEVLGIDVTLTDAVDGKALNSTQLRALGIEMLPGYKDPYADRVLTKGEIGCFLSHHNIWKKVVELQQQQVLVLEDDVRFEPSFKSRLNTILEDVKQSGLQWDLIYVGRKRLQIKHPEHWVEGVKNLVIPDYSYWTLGYALSLQGAKTLLEAQPLSKMLPVDEFLPAMFNKHPKEEYMSHFKQRNLKAFSVQPLLLFPSHYTGEPGYFSDTETSTIWDDETVATDWDRHHIRGDRSRGDKSPTAISESSPRDEL
ncbi:procollagen galactosyltransferase 2-like [Sinocyclocheilus rhinocerous]|uniref:procollagen galactosyltransferase 2-like n=1 Tax=Sinocyclocheilus rhinocerous TaxID=307959 RepID=UPI0007B7BCD7|nr:PREDICTED: procollagen galactosyltransferase 2-like [Sinocyclocheilus rhinocerous]